MFAMTYELHWHAWIGTCMYRAQWGIVEDFPSFSFFHGIHGLKKKELEKRGNKELDM